MIFVDIVKSVLSHVKQVLSAAELAEANVRQLQHEASIPKTKVSVAVKDLQVSNPILG